MITRPIPEAERKAIERVNLQEGRVNVEERIFYMLEGTNPTFEMKVLKSFGYRGQYEIR